MANAVSLPFCVPWFATTATGAAAGIAMQGHPTAHNGFLNQSTTLSCRKNFLSGYTSPQVGIPRIVFNQFPFIEHYGVNARFGLPFYLEIIKKMLDEGFYVFFNGVDDYYLPGKSWYGIRHIPHDGIVCGYDDGDATFSIAAYDINWVFRLIRIPQSSFLEGVRACVEEGHFGGINAYRVKEDTVVELDEAKILNYLKEYVSQTADQFSLEPKGGVEGIAVHDFLAMYIDKLKDGSIPSDKVDWRSMRPVWEHKRCMLYRIQAIEEKHGWGNDFSARYAPLVDDANRTRMMYAMFHKNQKLALLNRIKDGILSVRNREEKILQEFIKKMEAEIT